MGFFKTVFASFLGAALAFVIAGLMILVIIMAISSGSDKSATVLTNATVLKITLDEPIIERRSKGGPLEFDPTTFQTKKSIGLDHILASIESAAKDDNVKGIFLNSSSPMASMSTTQDIRNALLDFKASGKWIVAYAESFSQRGYWLNSVADEIYVYPEGGVDWSGLNVELTFFKNMLDKAGVEMQIVRGPNNKFKSAVEPYMYDHMSEANREQLEEFVFDFWNVMKDDVASSRSLSASALQTMADSLAIRTPQSAVQMGLIDELKYWDEIDALVANKIGANEDQDVNYLDLVDYTPKSKYKLNGDKIAVVYAVGEIVSGEGDDATIGSDRIAKALRDAREDDDVRAVVLRVNSPGGSALASDVIWRETDLIKQAGIPLIVSMGDVAASGGYYIAASADTIFANPTTITGSIGVFGMIPNAEKLLEDKIGITFDNVATAAHAGYFSVTEPLTDFEYTAIQASVVHVYDTFIGKVAEGRGMTPSQVDEIGQGRVWSGEDALRIGLVDKMGNLDDAIACAAGMASLKDFKLKKLPKPVDPFEEFLKNMGASASIDPQQVLGEDLGEFYKLYSELKSIQRLKGVQARLPFLYAVE